MQSNPTSVAALRAAAKTKINQLLALPQITLKDLNYITVFERKMMDEAINKNLAKLTGRDRDDFLHKIALIVCTDSRNALWENNHISISNAITNHIKNCGAMPTIGHIAAGTGLSRQTVAKHFKEYKAHPLHQDQLEQFKYMAPKVLANVFEFATRGDMRAARLYFEAVGALSKTATGAATATHNNYIQVNNTIISQENLKQLTADQLNQIENIIKKDEVKRLG